MPLVPKVHKRAEQPDLPSWPSRRQHGIDRWRRAVANHQRHRSGEERGMIKVTDTGEPASELERLIADLSESGQLIFVFGAGWWTGHLTGAATPVFRGPAGRRWWHVDLGDGAASWTMDVRVDEITGVRFVREPYPFPSFPGREVLTVQFLGPDVDTVLSCYVDELYDGQQMRPEKLAAWQALRERYGNRDESRVDQGNLLAPAA
jgi:hypothetical protein